MCHPAPRNQPHTGLKPPNTSKDVTFHHVAYRILSTIIHPLHHVSHKSAPWLSHPVKHLETLLVERVKAPA